MFEYILSTSVGNVAVGALKSQDYFEELNSTNIYNIDSIINVILYKTVTIMTDSFFKPSK